MIKHIVMWKFKEGEHDNMLIFRDRLLALKGQIPEIRAMEVGINMNPSDRSFDAVLVSEFDSRLRDGAERRGSCTRRSGDPRCGRRRGLRGKHDSPDR